MAELSFKERSAIKKQIGTLFEKIDSDKGMSFKERSTLKKQIGELFAQLEVAVAAQPEGTQKPESLLKLEAGDFDKFEPLEYLKKLKEIVEEIKQKDGVPESTAIEPIKQPTIRYIGKKLAEKSGQITESIREGFQGFINPGRADRLSRILPA